MPSAAGFEDTDSDNGLNFKPLTAQEAANLRAADPALSPWWVVGLQCVAGLLVSGLLALVYGKAAGWSAAYGAVAVVVPAALFARGIMGRFASLHVAAATFGFFLWEAVKLVVSVVLVALAPRLVVDLNWLALLAGLFVTLKMYWLALLKRPKSKSFESLRD